MTIKVNITIEADVQDHRHFSSVLNAQTRVHHAWTLVHHKSKTSPKGTKLSFLPRKGDAVITSLGSQNQWMPRGHFDVPHFATTDQEGFAKLKTTIPHPGSVFSILCNLRIAQAGTVAWALQHDKKKIVFVPHGPDATQVLSNGSAVHLGANAPLNEWVFCAVVVDLDRDQVCASTDNGPWTPAPVERFFPPQGKPLTVCIGHDGETANFADGAISDFAVVSGDVRTVPNLLAAWHHYNATGYV